jgi:hypothetical protein
MPRIPVTVPVREIATIYPAHAAFANQGGDFIGAEASAGADEHAGGILRQEPTTDDQVVSLASARSFSIRTALIGTPVASTCVHSPTLA